MALLSDGTIVIHDGNALEFIAPREPNEQGTHGLIPRPYGAVPRGSYPWASALDFPLIDPSEYAARIAEKDAAHNWLTDLRMKSGPGGGMIPSLDQNGKGYCLPAGEPVRMADGSERPIEQVKLGDSVLCKAGGKGSRVVQTHRRLYTGNLVGVSIEGAESPLIATADHRIAAIQNHAPVWLPAGQLSLGQHVCTYHGDRPVRFLKFRPARDLPVFDIGVEDVHSFLARDILVHNCWAHSGGSAHLLVRAKMGAPYAPLSAYSVACQIKGFRDEGGWGAQGVDWQVQNGIATSATWPQQSMSRANLNDAMKADAAKHKITGQWADLNSQQYDRSMSWNQLCTLLLSDCPVVTDFNWWSHSVCGCALTNGASQRADTRDPDSGKLLPFELFEAAWAMDDPVTQGLGLVIWNSWSDSWSNKGMGVLTGSKATPDGAVGLRSVAA